MQSEFIDELYIEKREEKRHQQFFDIRTGAYIKNELTRFSRQKLLDEQVSMLLPVTFVTMPPDIARMKFPSEFRPPLVKTSLDTSVNFTYRLIDRPLEDGQLLALCRQIRTLLETVNPAYTFFSMEEEPLAQGALGWFDFKSFAIDDNVYNIMYVTPVGGKTLLGTFTCSYADMDEWQLAAMQAILSVQDITGKKEVAQ